MNTPDAWHFDKRDANHYVLSPISFLTRTAEIFPDYPAIVHHGDRRNYRTFLAGCERASALLHSLGAGKGDVASVMLPNIPAIVELHFAGIADGGAASTECTA
jgi:fatty-acyl-CoA synthase